MGDETCKLYEDGRSLEVCAETIGVNRHLCMYVNMNIAVDRRLHC
jgi:hypothetical protein